MLTGIIGNLISFIFNYDYLRLLARLRSDFPLFFILLAFVVGQSCVFFGISFNNIIFYFLGFLFSFLAFRYYSILFVLFGILSTFHLRPEYRFTDFSEVKVLVKLQSGIKVSKVRDLRLSLKVLKSENQDLDGQQIYCRYAGKVAANINQIATGDIFYISAKFYSASPWLLIRGINAQCKIQFISQVVKKERNIFEVIKNRIVNKFMSLPGTLPDIALFLSMSVGFDTYVSNSDWQLFKQTGLAHLLVVSGFQLTLVYYFIVFLISRFLSLFRVLTSFINISLVASFTGLVSAIIYGLVVGLDAACQRAVLALALLFITKVFEIKTSFLNVILATFLLDIIISPLAYCQPGTQLTYSALVGIALGQGSKSKSDLLNYCKICFWATCATTPVVWYWFDSIYPISFFSNLVLAPLGSFIACQLGFLSILLSNPLEILSIFNLWLVNVYREMVGLFAFQEFFWQDFYIFTMLVLLFIKLLSAFLSYMVMNSSVVNTSNNHNV